VRRRREPGDHSGSRDCRRDGLRKGFTRADQQSQDEGQQSLTRDSCDHDFELT